MYILTIVCLLYINIYILPNLYPIIVCVFYIITHTYYISIILVESYWLNTREADFCKASRDWHMSSLCRWHYAPRTAATHRHWTWLLQRCRWAKLCMSLYVYIHREMVPNQKKGKLCHDEHVCIYIYMYISHTGIICYIDDSLWLTVKLAKPISPPLRKKNKSIGAIGDIYIYIYNHHKLRC